NLMASAPEKNVAIEKTKVRKMVQEVLNTMTGEQISVKSGHITQQVIHSPWWKNADIVLAFCSMDKEVDTTEIIKAGLQAGKVVGIPRVAGRHLLFHQIQSLDEDFAVGYCGIKEPQAFWPVVDPARLASQSIFVLTPGLAFDRKKNRLGRGKGFYDRLLAQLQAYHHLQVVPVGVCFVEQLLERVPLVPHDHPVEMVITENEIFS
ncbi:5-formyltetrahydrofolate cyclo-ligase, partial [candidate division KSB3 bacterium]|nr:5-formyltetrahydrofolate cyclo-ligase [candidate division KSB3 bacterium]MBD3326853.1 5-formyltetrahydrofolate cyclo-ligase [candidate division KSB3 bacterium]